MSIEAIQLTNHVGELTLLQRLMLQQLADNAHVDTEWSGRVTGRVNPRHMAEKLQVPWHEIERVVTELIRAKAIVATSVDDGTAWTLNIPQLPRSIRPTESFKGTGPCSVYVFDQIGSDLVKIGISEIPQSRAKALARDHGPLQVSGVWDFPSKAEAYDVEQAAHYLASERRHEGEWFEMTSDEALVVVNQIVNQEIGWARESGIGSMCFAVATGRGLVVA